MKKRTTQDGETQTLYVPGTQETGWNNKGSTENPRAGG